jgi:quinol monooxygenase YgiN
MVIRVATFNEKPEAHQDEALMAEFRAWMKSQPGFRAAWHTSDSKTGKALSISVWDDMESLVALKAQTFPGKQINLKPDKVEVFDQTIEF